VTRLVHLSDIHFGAELRPAVEAAVAYVEADPPDLIVVTGDLTMNGLPREFRAAAAWRRRLPDPAILTPGNHDTPYWNVPLRALWPFDRYRRYIGSPHSASFDSAALAVRMINTARGAQARPDWSKGAISLDAASAVVNDLAARPAETFKVVGCHHPLIDIEGSAVTGGVYRGDEAAQRFAQGGVDLILTGHVHVPFAVAFPFGDHRTYAVGAGTLSRRTRGAPPSFNVIEIAHEDAVVTAMAWTGAAFTLDQQWRLERRAVRCLGPASDAGRPTPEIGR
jgi:3',5'-cyclic AMP phosphodiesterase CpdA